MGYTTISSQTNGIEATTRYFVPLDENLEIWQLTVKNHRKETAELSIFSTVEFCLWDAQDDSTNFQRNFSIGEVEVENGVIYHKSEYREIGSDRVIHWRLPTNVAIAPPSIVTISFVVTILCVCWLGDRTARGDLRVRQQWQRVMD